MDNWEIAGAKIQGELHKKSNTPCQDSFELYKKHGFFCSSVADGAGSAENSELASKLVTRKVIHILKDNFDDFYNSDKLDVKTKIIHRLRTSIGILAKSKIASKDDFLTTLLFVAIKNNKYIAGHIGDGAIGMLSKNKLITLSPPLNGEYRNQTYFITSRDYKNHFRLYKGTLYDLDGFILVTDGTTDSLYNYSTNDFAKISSVIINWLDNHNSIKVSKAIKRNLSEVVSKKTTDDCTLVVMKRIGE